MKKLLWFIVSFLAFEVVILVLIDFILLLGELKLAITTDAMLGSVKELFLHPVQAIEGYVASKNPLFFILTVLNLFYSALLQLKRKTKKDGWDIHEKNAYHGSARWAKEKEILDGNFIAKSEKDVRETFLQSLKGRDVE
ncbi:hypothetical protein QI30_19595 [Kurthia sp. 3B1D]|uniref:Uncharacterized protein n=2 Tax=Candidatus Kurthia intestinigallinarum TaxID=1562256 RepID=A0A433RNM6_9BACL|nr:hypothetical protein [Kurthia sp. 3B1D]RUS49308.1 hypothetical protein QI30_20140 [Kurthia sp. 3B1D]RUS49887.1 hypothetical protein QI30_19595 [Kurthia sp. 3B1D]